MGQDTGFDGATELLSEKGIRRLPVWTAENELVGSSTADELQQLASSVQAQWQPD